MAEAMSAWLAHYQSGCQGRSLTSNADETACLVHPGGLRPQDMAPKKALTNTTTVDAMRREGKPRNTGEQCEGAEAGGTGPASRGPQGQTGRPQGVGKAHWQAGSAWGFQTIEDEKEALAQRPKVPAELPKRPQRLLTAEEQQKWNDLAEEFGRVLSEGKLVEGGEEAGEEEMAEDGREREAREKAEEERERAWASVMSQVWEAMSEPERREWRAEERREELLMQREMWAKQELSDSLWVDDSADGRFFRGMHKYGNRTKKKDRQLRSPRKVPAMTPLPASILESIMLLSDAPTMAAVALTSRACAIIARPRLYWIINIHYTKTRSLLTTIAQDPVVGQWVGSRADATKFWIPINVTPRGVQAAADCYATRSDGMAGCFGERRLSRCNAVENLTDHSLLKETPFVTKYTTCDPMFDSTPSLFDWHIT
ncbi:hypothetical protein B0H14DRAFT_2557597 [Mycena olivaceomarginata]|nr:hypothetical protein B0H14DRAFT_2557597 [Mycena olivaceomarginata]